MPAAIAAYLTTAALSTTAIGAALVGIGSLTVAGLVGAGVGLLISGIQAKSAQRKATDAANRAYEASLTDRTTVIRSPIVPRNIILGRARTSGPLLCWFNWGPVKEFHTFGVVLAGHECDAIEQYYFNEEPISLGSFAGLSGSDWVTTAKWCKKTVVTYSETVTFDGSGNATLTYAPVGQSGQSATATGFTIGAVESSTYLINFSGTNAIFPDGALAEMTVSYSYEKTQPLFRVRTYLGAAGQTAAQELIDAAAAAGTPAAWDSTRRGTQVCYCTVQMEADFDVLGQIGVPNVSAIARGVKAYDPRYATTAWTVNPAILARWFLVESIYSPTTLSAEIGEDELIASANVCDETIDFSATQNAIRYRCDGQLTCDAIPRDNLAEILKCMVGTAVWVSGAWQIVAGYYRTPTLTITESDLNGADIKVAPYVPKDKLFNLVTGTYPAAAMGYTRTTYPAVQVDTYVTQDNGETLPLTLDFGLVSDPVRCQYLAWLVLTQARQQLTLQLGTNLRGYDAWPTENVNVSIAELFGASPKVFAVQRREYADGQLSYVMQETGSAVWDWDYADAQQAVDIPNTALPDPFTLPAPVITAVESGDAQLLIGDDGSITSRIKVTLAGTDNTYIVNGGGVETRIAPTLTGEWQAGPAPTGNALEYWHSPVQDGTSYMMQARYRNSSGRLSAWSPTWMHTVVGKLEPPPAVTGVTLSTDRVFFNELTKAEVKDLAGYLVRAMPGTVAQWSLGTPLHVGIITDSPWLLPLALYGVQTVMVASIDTSGNVSALGVSSSATQDYGSPNTTNAIQQYDFGANDWPGEITNGTAGATIEADLDPAANFWNIGEDFWVRDNATDFWGGATYLPVVYIARFVPMYGGGQILLNLTTPTGSRTTIEYRIDGATLGDFWEGNGGAGGVTDFWSGDAFWGENDWQPWLGSAISARNRGIQWRVSIDGGPQQGVISEMIASLVLQLVSQVFGSQTFNVGGTRLDPALGNPVRNWVSVSAATPTPDGSIAVTGRVADYDPDLGPLIYLLDETGAAVTDTGNAIVFVFEDATS